MAKYWRDLALPPPEELIETSDKMAPETSPESAIRIAFIKGNKAARANLVPGVILWTAGLAIIFGYYRLDFLHEGLESLGELKTRTGWVFGIVSTMIFGGLLPVVLPIILGKPVPARLAGLLVSNAIFWGYKGFEVDLLYHLQSWAFGDGTDLTTILVKVFVDAAIYAPAIGLFNCIIFYLWRDNGYSLIRLRKSLGKNWYVRKILPALISNWCVWLPAAALIYSLPLALQLPMQNLILCFWVLILVFFTTDESNTDRPAVERQ